MEIYIKSKDSLDELGQKIKSIVEISDANRRPYHRIQKRHGLNLGGDYYLFESPDEILRLVENKGEMLVEERKDWDYYILVESNDGKNKQTTDFLLPKITAAGIKAELDDIAV